jgi:hypothetical protein
MAHVYFHCSNAQGALVDRCGAEVCDLIEAHDYAARFVQSLIAMPSLEDWRNWVLQVSDDLGGVIFAVSFDSVLGKPN